MRREGAIANKWENNWGFLTGQYRTVRGTLSAFADMADIGEKIQPGLEPGLEICLYCWNSGWCSPDWISIYLFFYRRGKTQTNKQTKVLVVHLIHCPLCLQLRTDIAQIRGRRSPKDSEPPLKLPPLKAPKQDTRNPFPMVTSKEIGWQSEHKLEVYGRWGRPKYSIEKQLKWPFDSIP